MNYERRLVVAGRYSYFRNSSVLCLTNLKRLHEEHWRYYMLGVRILLVHSHIFYGNVLFIDLADSYHTL